MKNLFILVKMQLKEQLNFKRLEVESISKFSVLVSIIAAILKFASITALCAVFLLAARYIGVFSFANFPVPATVISLVFSCMLLVATVSCTVGLTGSMYYARDNAVLLTLPCTPTEVYLSKLIIFFVFEVKRNFSFIIPLFIAYYATTGYSVAVYPWMLFCILWVSLFSVAIGALLSIPAMWIANFVRQRRWIQISGIGITVAVAVSAVFWGISLIPENIDIIATWETTYWDIQKFLAAYSEKFSALYDITLMMLGETKNLKTTFPIVPTLLRFSMLAAATVVLLAIGLLIVRPLFYRMASTPFEYLKKQTKPKRNLQRTRRVSAVYYEWLIALKNSSRMLSNVGILISVPMLTFLLNKIFLAMNTRTMGNYMIVSFNILIILLLILNSNTYASSIFSREGRSSYLIKNQPSKYPLLILSKLLPNTVFGCLSLVATFGILISTLSVGFFNLLMLIVGIGACYLGHLLHCAELDLMNPQTELYATVGGSESNPNETGATVLAFLISFAAAGVVFLLQMQVVGFNVYAKCLIAGLAFMAFKIWTFFNKLRLYYKEK